MTYRFVFITLLLSCLSIAPPMLLRSAESGSMLQVTELISHPDHYDRQMVVVIGRVRNLQTVSNRQGQPGYGFLLADNGGTVKVVALGRAEFEEGDDVIVEGVFNRLRQTGRSIVYNEIKATAIRPISRLNPELVG
jgi:cytochrome c-type biogenesis protein CcmE